MIDEVCKQVHEYSDIIRSRQCEPMWLADRKMIGKVGRGCPVQKTAWNGNARPGDAGSYIR